MKNTFKNEKKIQQEGKIKSWKVNINFMCYA